jgi:catechol-2,3-dioxygenase
VLKRVTLHAGDREASARFYATVVPTLAPEAPQLLIVQATAAHAPTRRLHVAFVAPTRAHVDAFWQAGTAAGHPDDGAPGPREHYAAGYYGGFLLDPDGNSAEAVHHQPEREAGTIDHLWIRVADVARSREFYSRLASNTGFHLAREHEGFAQFAGPGASFTFVEGRPTENVGLTFAAAETATLTDPDGNTVVLDSQPRPPNRPYGVDTTRAE